METYHYEATTRDGNVVSGTIEGVDDRSAIDRIQDMGYFPIKVSKAVDRENFLDRILSSTQGRITEKDVMNFTYQVGVLLDAGFALERSLLILSDLVEKKKLKELLKELLSQIRSGKAFSDALSKFPRVFPPFYVNMIKAGEAGGFLEDSITRMAAYLESSHGLKSDVRSALIYPAFLCFVMGAMVIMLLAFVVPQFTKIFSDMEQTLPLPTVMLLAVSDLVTDYWWLMLLSAGAVVVLVRRYLSTESGRKAWDRLKFKLPVFGTLFKETAVSRFSRTLGTLLASGVPMLNAFQIVKGTIGNERLSEIITSVRESARKGKGISEELRKSDIFPPIAVHMITVGEESGRLDEMLMKIADRFDIEIKTTVKRMLSLLEPALILLMGLVVGFIVVSMLMAIFSVNELPV